jgi:hypothetical protein
LADLLAQDHPKVPIGSSPCSRRIGSCEAGESTRKVLHKFRSVPMNHETSSHKLISNFSTTAQVIEPGHLR